MKKERCDKKNGKKKKRKGQENLFEVKLNQGL